MSKCWYCNNELTSGDNPKHFGICNKCYDEMFKSGDTIIRSLTDKIAELQKQLHDLPKKIVGEIRKEIEFPLYVHPDFDEFECLFDIDKLLDTILKEYQK